MKIAALLLAAILPQFGAATAAAQVSPEAVAPGRTYVVDDAGSIVLDPYLEMQAEPVGRSVPGTIVSGSTRVSVQLNLAAWRGRAGRIYMTLPRTAGPTVRASWTTGGTMLPGTLLSGERALVLAGPIAAPVVRDIIDIRLEVDGSRLLAPEALAFGFEIEVEP